MNLQTHPEIFERHPELAALVDMLLEAEVAYLDFKKTHERAHKDHPDVKKRQYQGRAKCYAKIAKYYKGGTWHFPPSNPTTGKAFEHELHRVLALTPDKVIIDLYKGSTLNSLKTGSEKFDITDKAVNVKEPENEPKQPAVLGELSNQLAQLQDTVSNIKTTPASDGNGNINQKMLEMQMLFDKQLSELKHSADLKEKQLVWERKEENYEREIKELKEEISILEEEISESSNALNGLAAEHQQKHIEDNTFGKVAERFGVKLITGILSENPTILKKGLGMTDADIQEWISKDVNQAKSVGDADVQSEDASGFKRKSEADQFAGLSDDHVEGIKTIIAFCKQIGPESFKKVYEVFVSLQDETNGMLNENMAKQLILTASTQQ